MNRRTCATVIALAASLVAATPAYAAAPASGRVTLYADSAARYLTYDQCATPQSVYGVTADSFSHTPLPGCVAQLVKDAQQFTLCAGRGAVPGAFRTGSVLRIKPGLTPACRA